MERAGPRERLAAAALGLTACGVERIGDPSGGPCIPPAVQAIFDARCNLGTSCHSAGSNNVSFDASESATIIGGASKQSTFPLVELGSVEGSYLAHKIMAVPPVPIESGTTRMPQNADFSDPALAEDMATLLGWIAGAELPGCVGGSDSGGNEVLACGLADLDPGGMDTLVAGDAAMQIPTEIGMILDTNCGCHLTTSTTLARMAIPYPAAGAFAMSTWADWHSDYGQGITMLQQARTFLAPPTMPMPPPGVCNDGMGNTMPPDQRTRLLEWIDADAPDGASWPP